MGLFSAAEPKTYQVLGEWLRCQVCANDTFWHREAQLNTAVATFFNFDWANQSAQCLVCARCGYIHWFIPQ